MTSESEKLPFQVNAEGRITELKGTPLPDGIVHFTVTSPPDANATAIGSESVVRGAYHYAERLRQKADPQTSE